ncbi:MAG: type II toxin-antitoxin system HicB family antitoxin [bacterium]|nr:type II toxin-antitoxin system HicB family antitoxin [bacterium]
MLDLKTIIWKEGKSYIAQCVNVDVSSFGKTKQEALENLREALELYFEDISASTVAKVEHLAVGSLMLRHA